MSQISTRSDKNCSLQSLVKIAKLEPPSVGCPKLEFSNHPVNLALKGLFMSVQNFSSKIRTTPLLLILSENSKLK